MLGKLIKHDFKSLSRLLVPTQLCVIGATILATLGFSFNTQMEMNAARTIGAMQILRVITSIISGLLVFGIFASFILVAVIIFYNFYKSIITDEGYLTFTLPTTPTKILWSKLICAMLWTLICGVVIFLCLNIFMAFGFRDGGVLNGGYVKFISEFFRQVGQHMTWSMALLAFEVIFLMIMSVACGILQIYLALIIGGVVAKKNKLLAGIGFFFAINVLVSILATIGQFGVYEISFSFSEGHLYGLPSDMNYAINVMQPIMIYYIGMSIVLAAAYFLTSNWLMKNKLNLP